MVEFDPQEIDDDDDDDDGGLLMSIHGYQWLSMVINGY